MQQQTETLLERLPRADINNGSGEVRTIVDGASGHRLSATYWSRPGKPVISIHVRTAFHPVGLFYPGQTIPDTEGTMYVIADVREPDDRSDSFREARLTAVRQDLWDAEQSRIEAEAEYRRTAADPRLPELRRLLRQAVDRTGMGWYTDVYLDEEDGLLKVGCPVSTGFRTHARQDDCHVLYRVEAESRIHEIPDMAIAAVGELRTRDRR